MRRFRKVLIFVGACAAALGLTIRWRGQDLRVETNAPLRAAVRSSAAAYDLSQIPIFTKTLYYVQGNYFDKSRFDHRRMLVGALDFLQRDVPEILVDRQPEQDPRQVTVKVGGQQKTFDLQRVDSPWVLRSTLQEIFRFVQPNLAPVQPKEEAKRLVEIETAATNGMLYTLDPHSVLLDVESFKEMRTQTQGKFGGLGIVIMMDPKGRIMVRKPMPNTPAMRAGIKAKDRIVRINNESTVNMTLNEAVERLRGDVNSSVDVFVERDGSPGMKKFPIVRDFIRPPAIDPPARVLTSSAAAGVPSSKVGYAHITSFSANTERDLNEALEMFDKEKVKGIVIDLRGNPGGLYDQAQKVADAFIDNGVLVSMVGVGGAQRKDEKASRNGDTKVPVAVLVDQNSASASEIVAGAMKNLDRGVIVGETTFGKGSVQMLFDIPSPVQLGPKGSEEEHLGLKLTTAQYLTPGDVSIQGVGVTPDIELVPMQVLKRPSGTLISLQRSAHRRQEADYEWHLENPNARKGIKPSEVLSYLWVPPPGSQARLADDDEGVSAEDKDDLPEPDLDENKSDFLMEFARDLVAQAKSPRRKDIIAASKPFLDRMRTEEDKRLSQALEKLGVDWSPGAANEPAGQVQVTLAPVEGGNKVLAGNVVKVRGTVKNTGTTPVHRVHAVLKSDNPLFDENEMVFGKIAPGETKSYDLVVKVPRSMQTRTDIISANVVAAGALKANMVDLLLNVEGKPRPLFAYTYQTIDDIGGNHDGQVQRGEQVSLLVKVKNIGAGPSPKTEAILRNGASQEGILISAGRFETKDLGPGATKNFSFVYTVDKDFKGDDYQLELVVADTVLGESVTDKIKIKVAPSPAPVQAATGTVTLTTDAQLREAPLDSALVVGKVAKGTTFKITGKAGSFTRIELEEGRPAFVSNGEVQSGGTVKTGPRVVAFQPRWQVSPPLVTVSAPTAVSSGSVHIKGLVTDDNQVKDLYVRVINRDSKMPPKKVYYLPNHGDKTKLPFEVDVPLWPGSNFVQVFARETNEVQSVATLVVLQRPEAQSLVQRTTSVPPDPPTGLKGKRPRPAEAVR